MKPRVYPSRPHLLVERTRLPDATIVSELEDKVARLACLLALVARIRTASASLSPSTSTTAGRMPPATD